MLKASPGLCFRGHSDTEVMLAAFEQWGIESSLERMNGMFAFALWDRDERTLLLARDRFGEKPLYYGKAGGVFLFASELKALQAHPAFNAEIDRDALACYLQFNCVPAPYSIYRGIRKLLPGTLLRYRSGEISISAFWSARTCVEQCSIEPFRGSETEAMEELDWLLRDAVRLRMHSDVPLGAFLSGGIDSSLIVASCERRAAVQSARLRLGSTIRRTIRLWMTAVTRHFGTEHAELYVTPAEQWAWWTICPELMTTLADSSQIPTLLISRFARRHVTVGLSAMVAMKCSAVTAGAPGAAHYRTRSSGLPTGYVVSPRLPLSVSNPTIRRGDWSRPLFSAGVSPAYSWLSYTSWRGCSRLAIHRHVYEDGIAFVVSGGRGPRIGLALAVPHHRTEMAHVQISRSRRSIRTAVPTCRRSWLNLIEATMASGLEGRIPYLDAVLCGLPGSSPSR